MRQLIAGNWKMNGLTADAASLAAAVGKLAHGLDCDMLVCPPFTQIGLVADVLGETDVAVGGQDCAAEARGAHTGDIAAEMLADAGCIAVILGHSERRQHHGETSAHVRAKARAAARAGLVALVCVGVVAYEPVWAIGTGRTPTEADVEAVHRRIRAALVTRLGESGRMLRILYGGSVKPDNAAALLAVPEVGGALIGGASLHAESFLAIARSCRT